MFSSTAASVCGGSTVGVGCDCPILGVSGGGCECPPAGASVAGCVQADSRRVKESKRPSSFFMADTSDAV